jgi:CRISPR-associated protein Csd1
MAVLAGLQEEALPGVGAGVTQRYYAATSATPALTFGRLLRNAQFHLDKLGGGLRFIFENRMAEISVRIGTAFPATLDLEGQSLFALGYYQQLAEQYRQMAEHKRKRLEEKQKEKGNE